MLDRGERLHVVRRWLLPFACLAAAGYAHAQSDDATGAQAPASGWSSVAPPSPEDGDIRGSDPNRDYSRLSPFTFGAASYQPGFDGCALAGSALRDPQGVFAELVRPEGLSGRDSRFFRLSLGASETYTDNLRLAPEGEEISDYITQITPRVDACANSGRIRGELAYQLQGVVYAHNSRFNDVYSNIAGNTTIELLAGRLFLGADTSYGQSVVDPSLSYSRSSLLRADNSTSAWITNISPYYLQPLGPLGDATLRYRYGRTVYGDSDIPESRLQGAYFDLYSPPTSQEWSWHVNAFTQRVRRIDGDAGGFFDGVDFNNGFFDENGQPIDPADFYDERPDSRTTYFDKATIDIGYRVSPTLQLLVLGGLEDEYESDGTNDRLSSPLWNVGFRWDEPSRFLEARIGHRFFGTSYFLTAGLRGRILDVSLSYTEEPSTQDLNQLNRNATVQNTAFPDPTTSLFERSVFVEKEVSVSAAMRTGLARTTVTGYHQRREYIANVPEEQLYGAAARIDYQLRPRTALVPSAGWEHRESRLGMDTDVTDLGLSVVRSLSTSLQASLGYSHAWRDADSRETEYDENRVVLQVMKYY
ncbi:hypothetical protein SADO_15664 [Salinisphaera dokdonensis CL-ES53]|uniref:TIGR03016 family PEP-CTERM system-associated outer membrane protein n=1 Tax=Salinisphaera dokdonensis CL-ES53 TaxID=1304272 RepID=A0ABV2B5K0_9GAMM